MSADNHFIFAMVDGPSESNSTSSYQERPCEGALMRILSFVFTAYGDQVGSYVCVRHWRTPIPLSSHRQPPRLFGYAEKVNRWIRLARVTGRYSILIFLADNDRFSDTPSRQDQLAAGIAAALHDDSPPHRPIVIDGVAVEMIESWLLSDPELVAHKQSLPAGKCTEEFWGDERDQSSHHPKCLLLRHVCAPRHWDYSDCIQHWNVGKAVENSPSLRCFVEKLRQAATELDLR